MAKAGKRWAGRALGVALAAYALSFLHAELDEGLTASLGGAQRELEEAALRSERSALSAEQVTRFQEDGFLIVRGLLPAETIRVLFDNRPRSIFPTYLKPLEWVFAYLSASHISIDAIWSESGLFRSFWFRGPVAHVVSQLMGGERVRLLTDIVYGIPKGRRPKFLGVWHKDSTSFDIVDRESAQGMSAWIPLTAIDARKQGGSLFIGNISRVSADCQAMPDDDVSAACKRHLDEVGSVFSFQRGDVLFFTDYTFHRSQPLGASAPLDDRFALVGRFVHADAQLSESDQRNRQRKNYCNHELKLGEPLHSPCFPQVFPRPAAAPHNVSSLALPSRGSLFFTNLLRQMLEDAGLA